MAGGALATALARAAARLPEPRFEPGAPGPGWTDLAAPEDAAADWMAGAATEHAGMTADVAAAFVAGRLAVAVGEALAALALVAGVGPGTDWRLSVRPERYRWEHEGERGEATRFRVRVDGDAAATDGIARPLAAALAPAVACLAALGGLGRVALWRQAADAAAYACLRVGRDLGDAEAGMALGRAMLAAPGPLRSPKAVYLRVEAAGAADWFLLRGGCCRVFACAGEDYCSTCVHRPVAERRALLADWLARRAAGAAA